MQSKYRKDLRQALTGWALVLPSLAGIGLFTLYPVLSACVSSLFRDNLSTSLPLFIGLGNFRDLYADPVFRKVLGNSIWFSAATVPLSMLVALALALLLQHCSRRLRPYIRLFWFYPTVIPLVAAANIWLFIYTPDYGLLDSLFGAVGIRGHNWLGSPDSVLPALVAFYVWKQAGYFMLFFLAGLQQINGDYYEAAKLDGARYGTVLRRITLPLLMPTLLFVFIIAATASFKTVDHLVIMTRGGPDNASNLLLYYIFETAFSFWDIGRAAAMTVVLIALMFALIVLNLRYFDKRIHYQG